MGSLSIWSKLFLIVLTVPAAVLFVKDKVWRRD